MEGLARSAGLERERDRLLSAGPGNPIRLSGCTNFAAVPPATRADQVYVSWNMDLPEFFRWVMGKMPIYLRRIAGCKPYLCVGSPLLFGMGVMNSDGLCAAINAVGMTDAGEGLMAFELNNLMMETCSTLEEALDAARSNQRQIVPGIMSSMLLNMNTLMADVSGEAALLEYSHNHMEVTRAADHRGVLASANHHQFLDRGLSGCADPSVQPEIAGSYARVARMWELLDLYHGSISPAVAGTITSDHGANYETLREFGMEPAWHGERVDDSTICAHPWNFWNSPQAGGGGGGLHRAPGLHDAVQVPDGAAPLHHLVRARLPLPRAVPPPVGGGPAGDGGGGRGPRRIGVRHGAGPLPPQG